MRTLTKAGLVLGPVLLLALTIVWASGYFFTDSAYERLIATKPSTRADILRVLAGFREVRITDPSKMQPLLKDNVIAAEGMAYYRYTKYFGFPIDVIYDQEGSICGLWPEYE